MSNMQARWRLMAATLTAVLVAGCGSTAADIPGPVHHVSMKLTESSANFGLTLLDKLLTQSDAGNVFISPLSATIMLSMAASAAKGDTRAKMLTALGLDPSVDPSGELRQTIQRLNQSDANAQLELAQAVWVQNGLKLNAAYEAKLGNDYQEIGDKLSLGPETVRTHVRKACRRLKASTRTQVVATALRLGLIE